jgi:hypothetical protein
MAFCPSLVTSFSLGLRRFFQGGDAGFRSDLVKENLRLFTDADFQNLSWMTEESWIFFNLRSRQLEVPTDSSGGQPSTLE